MNTVRLTIATATRKVLDAMQRIAEQDGDLRTVKRIMAVLAVARGVEQSYVAQVLRMSPEFVGAAVRRLVMVGPAALKDARRPGRPSKLTKTQRKQLKEWIIEGPTKVGFPGACWRSPMIQALIYDRFQVFYSVRYISQLLRNMGFSYQKAKFVSDHKDPEKRKQWLDETWPEIMKIAKEKNAYVLFGDEASFPQWGSLTYTWALRGQQPVVPTSGTRRGYKVFGLIDYFTGRFFFKGKAEGRLNSESYAAFLKEVLGKTRKHVIVIQDGAKYHVSKAMKAFFEEHQRRLTVFQLPSYSPDYNPIEKLWKKIKEHEIHLHHFPTFDSLVEKVESGLANFENLHHEVLSLFGFYRELPGRSGVNSAQSQAN